MAPAGGSTGPVSTVALPQISAGAEVGAPVRPGGRGKGSGGGVGVVGVVVGGVVTGGLDGLAGRSASVAPTGAAPDWGTLQGAEAVTPADGAGSVAAATWEFPESLTVAPNVDPGGTVGSICQ